MADLDNKREFEFSLSDFFNILWSNKLLIILAIIIIPLLSLYYTHQQKHTYRVKLPLNALTKSSYQDINMLGGQFEIDDKLGEFIDENYYRMLLEEGDNLFLDKLIQLLSSQRNTLVFNRVENTGGGNTITRLRVGDYLHFQVYEDYFLPIYLYELVTEKLVTFPGREQLIEEIISEISDNDQAKIEEIKSTTKSLEVVTFDNMPNLQVPHMIINISHPDKVFLEEYTYQLFYTINKLVKKQISVLVKKDRQDYYDRIEKILSIFNDYENYKKQREFNSRHREIEKLYTDLQLLELSNKNNPDNNPADQFFSNLTDEKSLNSSDILMLLIITLLENQSDIGSELPHTLRNKISMLESKLEIDKISWQRTAQAYLKARNDVVVNHLNTNAFDNLFDNNFINENFSVVEHDLVNTDFYRTGRDFYRNFIIGIFIGALIGVFLALIRSALSKKYI